MRTTVKLISVALLCVLLVVPACVSVQPMQRRAPTDSSDLRILYAGHPGSEREADFVEFLKPHFKEVGTGDLAAFTQSDAASFDVVILDYDGDGFEAPQPRLMPDYTRATVTVGVVGAFICGRRGLKTGYL